MYRRARWWALCALCAVCALWGVAPRSAQRTFATHVRHVQPHQLAHALADISHQPDVSSWSLLWEQSVGSSWHYSVVLACGARCAGSARVECARQHEAAPQHGAATPRAHLVSVEARRCTAVPLLGWPQLCDETTVRWEVRRAAEGAHVAVSGEAHCGAGWGCAARLRRHLDEWLRHALVAAAL